MRVATMIVAPHLTVHAALNPATVYLHLDDHALQYAHQH